MASRRSRSSWVSPAPSPTEAYSCSSSEDSALIWWKRSRSGFGIEGPRWVGRLAGADDTPAARTVVDSRPAGGAFFRLDSCGVNDITGDRTMTRSVLDQNSRPADQSVEQMSAYALD